LIRADRQLRLGATLERSRATSLWENPMKIHSLVLGALLVAAYADTAHAQSSWETRETQQRLQTLGFYAGPIDGIWGPETQAAVVRYQQSQGRTAYGGVEPARVIVGAPPAVVPPVVLPPAVAPAVVAPPTRPVVLTVPTDVRTVQTRLRQLTFYGGPIDGVWGPGTQAGMENFQRSRGLQVGQIDTATLSAMGLESAVLRSSVTVRDPLDPGVIRGVQYRLRQYGFYGGGIDGVWGPETERSLAQFQRSREIEPSGLLTPTTAAALGLDPNNLASSAVPPLR
jgi:peptidoglycan hydrolase-like protein with peptidoglycan-binding domain